MSSVINEKVSMDNYIYNVEGYSVNWTNMMDDLFDSSSLYNELQDDENDLFSKLSFHLTEMKRARDNTPPIPLTAQIRKKLFIVTKKKKQPYNRKTRHANMVRSN